MKTFREHLNEEVAIGALSSGGIDIERDAVRDEVNGILAGIAARPCVTPYSSLNKVRKALAYFHIHLPKKVYLEGRHGIEVWEVNQFGIKMGVTDQGEWINHVPAKYYLFFHYHLMGSMYYLQAKIVDEKELESKIGTAERMVAEETDAATRQAVAKAAAPKEKAHTALGDCDCSQGDSPSTKKAVDVSMKKQIDEDDSTKAIQKIVAKNKLKDIAKSGKKKSQAWYDKMTKRANQKEEVELDEVSLGKLVRYKRGAENSHGDATWETKFTKYMGDDASPSKALARKREKGIALADKKMKGKAKVNASMPKNAYMEEDKDPCWKGYEMVGMKKKGGRKVPNCVPVKEEQIGEGRVLRPVNVKDDEPKPTPAYAKKIEQEKKDAISKKRNDSIKRDLKKFDKKGIFSQINEKLTKRMSAADVIHDFVHSDDPKFKGKSTKERQKMALGAYYSMHPEKSKKNLDEEVSAMRKMKQKMETKVRHGMGTERQTQSVVVKIKGDPSSRPHRIPKSKYDPSKHQTV